MGWTDGLGGLGPPRVHRQASRNCVYTYAYLDDLSTRVSNHARSTRCIEYWAVEKLQHHSNTRVPTCGSRRYYGPMLSVAWVSGTTFRVHWTLKFRAPFLRCWMCGRLSIYYYYCVVNEAVAVYNRAPARSRDVSFALIF